MLRRTPKKPEETTTTEEAPLLAFDKRLQQREKPKKQSSFGKPKPKPEASATAPTTPEEAPPPGTFFKVKPAEKKKSPGFGRR